MGTDARDKWVPPIVALYAVSVPSVGAYMAPNPYEEPPQVPTITTTGTSFYLLEPPLERMARILAEVLEELKQMNKTLKKPRRK